MCACESKNTKPCTNAPVMPVELACKAAKFLYILDKFIITCIGTSQSKILTKQHYYKKSAIHECTRVCSSHKHTLDLQGSTSELSKGIC